MKKVTLSRIFISVKLALADDPEKIALLKSSRLTPKQVIKCALTKDPQLRKAAELYLYSNPEVLLEGTKTLVEYTIKGRARARDLICDFWLLTFRKKVIEELSPWLQSEKTEKNLYVYDGKKTDFLGHAHLGPMWEVRFITVTSYVERKRAKETLEKLLDLSKGKIRQRIQELLDHAPEMETAVIGEPTVTEEDNRINFYSNRDEKLWK
jgi:hypothetical protein